MSDTTSTSEHQLQMEEIYICDDVLLGVFAFLDPLELGLKMALISDRLDVLVDVHFKSREWSLDPMIIRRARRKNVAQIVKRSGKRLPIPQGPLPNKVIGFQGIVISYIDQTVVEFLQRIRPLFDSSGTTVDIDTADNQNRSWEIIWQNIWPLVSDNICCFLRLNPPRLDHLRQFSPAILRNCANLRSIYSCWLFPAFPAEDNAGASSHQAVTKWLLTPRGDGLPKMLRCSFYSAGMEGLKEAFVNASESANFIISIWRSSTYVINPFELTNNFTGERLTLRRFNEVTWLLVRCSIGREEDKWTNWEEEAIGWQWRRQSNRIAINFKDGGIGCGMVEANAGPSEPKKPKNDRLDVLVDAHFKSRKWSLDWLDIRRATDGNGAEVFKVRSDEVLPIPQGPIPGKVIGFEHIEISYVDQTVIEFLQRICRLNSSGTNVAIDTPSDDQSRSWGIIRQNIWPLVSDNICGLGLFKAFLDYLRRFSPAIIRNCAKLRLIDSFGVFPEFPAEDSANASSDQALAKWLLTPHRDGLPKILRCGFYSAGMEGLKRAFANASEPVNFIIEFRIYDADFMPFELTNNRTGERLTFRHLNEDNWLLVRCPIGREEDKWTNWEKEAIEWDWDNQWNRIEINFKDGDIGDGMVGANEGPSEPTN
uniref:F-box domain-containing protein n=1 Tax=Globodera pallida TaxID=36090 RepID=A0A183C6P9_GLOPA